MKNILITGASGFIGSALMKKLSAQEDLNILAVSRSRQPTGNSVQQDISEGIDVSFRPDVVVHAAAYVSPWGDDEDYTKNNILATKNVIEFCENRGLPKIIFLSTSSVYFRHEDQFDLREDSPTGPEFICKYAQSKYTAETLVRNYAGDNVILRPAAVFGPGDTLLFPRLISAATKQILPVLKFDGPPAIGDFIYIDNLCNIIDVAIQSEKISGTYNVTNAEHMEYQSVLLSLLSALSIPAPRLKLKAKSLLSLATILESAYRCLHIRNEPPITKFGASMFAYSRTLNVSRMLEDFGKPSVSMEDGLERLIQWSLPHV